MRSPFLAAAAGVLVSCGPGGELDLAKWRAGLGGYPAGIDRAGALSVSEAQSYTSQYGIAWSGAYIGGPCNGGSGWTPSQLTAINQAVSWKFMPTYVGQTNTVCSSNNFTASQGTIDGNDAVSIMASYSWSPDGGIPICLDYEAQNPATTAYVSAWVNAVHAGGYKAYVYSNPTNLNALSSLPIDGAWIAAWIGNGTVGYQSGESPYNETATTGFQNHDRAWQYSSGSVDWDVADIILAPPPGQVNGPAPTLDQLSGNDAVTVINWQSGETEAFYTSSANELWHLRTNGGTDTWVPAQKLASGASCGSASIYWPAPWLYAEVFSPLTDGGTGHLWWTSGNWNTYQPLGGVDLSHVEAVTWQDGHTEVFALGSDRAVWHEYWDLSMSAWSGWQSLGGAADLGPSPILFPDGHGEVFAATSGGQVSRITSQPGGWSTWSPMGGNAASRPVPVRLHDGSVRLYTLGIDGLLYEAQHGAGGWSALSAVESAFALTGVPSLIPNPDGTVELFGRDPSGQVVHATSGTPWSTPVALGAGLVAASDPFGWVRLDASVEVFAVDGQGALQQIHRGTNGAWTSWQPLATGAMACAPALRPPDAGTTGDAGTPGDAGSTPPSDAGAATNDAGASRPGTVTGCHCGAGPGTTSLMLSFGIALLARRRRTRVR